MNIAKEKIQRRAAEKQVDRGPWIETSSGAAFFPQDPRPEDLDIRVIAHALSNKCRFTGHCRCFYSVAQHSVLTLQEAQLRHLPHLELCQALLHDAAEAYLPDVARPLHGLFPELSRLEMKIMLAVARKWEFLWPMSVNVKACDNALLAREAIALMPSRGEGWDLPWEASQVQVVPWHPEMARDRFIIAFRDLYGREY